MVLEEATKQVIEATPFLSLVTVGADGAAHPIITGRAQVVGDTVVFGIYKMETTQKNLKSDNRAWVVAATKEGGPKGYRLSGTAQVQDKQLIFTPSTVEALI